MTQNAAILAELVRRHGQWVPMPELAAAAGCYAVHSRISDLRAEGHTIETKIEGTRPRRSSYRLTSPIQLQLTNCCGAQPSAPFTDGIARCSACGEGAGISD